MILPSEHVVVVNTQMILPGEHVVVVCLFVCLI